MIELGDHCHTHILPRLKKVIDGEDLGGITEDVGWKGGGGFRYYSLAPSMLEKDEYGNFVISRQHNAPMLAEAMCKQMGFTFSPSDSIYWQHGHSSETDFIYVTTQTLSRRQLAALSDEVGEKRSLMVCCSALRSKVSGFANLTLVKIPNAVLERCEWGKDDYSLNVANLPMMQEVGEDSQPEPAKPQKSGQGQGRNKGAGRSFCERGQVKHTIHSIGHRLSLRPPQFRSLGILEQVSELIALEKDADSQQALEAIRTKFPWVESFDERDFPSLCFALATGVGKTRLMGAFIAYLNLAQGVRHFFVLAPNLTIYNKLIADFTPNTPKYVFRGIADYALNAPEIITGDNYESGRGVRDERRRQRLLPGVGLFGGDDPIHINIFNISKINSETRGGKSPRIKRLHEYIGESYFDYLAGLDDLVLLMDESHRYRATAGVRAINELKPILGLEVTATPRVEKGGKSEDFKNVIYSYPLSEALRDGFVKEPRLPRERTSSWRTTTKRAWKN